MRRGAYSTEASVAASPAGATRIGHIEDLAPAPDGVAGESAAMDAPAVSADTDTVQKDLKRPRKLPNPVGVLTDPARCGALRVYAPSEERSAAPSPFDRLVERDARPEVKRARADMHSLNTLTVLASAVLHRQVGDDDTQTKARALSALVHQARVLSRALLRTSDGNANAAPKWLQAESLGLAAEIVAENHRNGLVDFGQPDQLDLIDAVLSQEDVEQFVDTVRERVYAEATSEDIAAARLRITVAAAASRIMVAVKSARAESGEAIAFEGRSDEDVLERMLDVAWTTARSAPVVIDDMDTATAYLQSATKRATEILCVEYERAARRAHTLEQCEQDVRESVGRQFRFIEGTALDMFKRDFVHEKQQTPQERG